MQECSCVKYILFLLFQFLPLRIDNCGCGVIYAVALFSIAIPVTLTYYTSNDRE